VESKATVRGVQAILRRLKFLAPEVRTVRARGVDPEVLGKALAKEDLAASEENADAEIYWQPGERFSGTSGAKAVAVVAAEVAANPLPHVPVDKPAQTYIPLRDWVTGWFAKGSLGGKLLAPILVSPAVGDRPTRVPLKGSREWIFTSKPLVGPVEERGYAFKMALVSGFGCGFFPLMPATLACVTMMPIALALYILGGWPALFVVSTLVFLASTVASVALEKWAGRQLLAEDPREFVLDEYAGMALTWMFLPPGAPWWAVVAGFFLFRIFDIFKWGVHWVEELPISGKIVWDDVLAGLYAGIALWVLCWFL
jgi:phosphatidylglycerophosphatase A